MQNKLRLVRHGNGWWIADTLGNRIAGAYDTRVAAEEDRRGLQRTYDHIDDPSFFTCMESPKKPVREGLKIKVRL